MLRFILVCLVLLLRSAVGLLPPPSPPLAIDGFGGTGTLAAYVGAFSATHVGLSAVRDTFIDGFGRSAGKLGLVGNDGWTLPQVWLGDGSSKDTITGRERLFPDEATAGRQIFRIFYSLVAAATLGGAFEAFGEIQRSSPVLPFLEPVTRSSGACAVLYFVAAAAQGISLASLVNPSPLSLVPGFQADPGAPLQLKRNDSLKLRPYGLTRITRHPLILPVVPWGVANACLSGGRVADVVLFVGLAIYALVGCYAQDKRAAAAAEVGTVFAKGDLTEFYADTSFLPFAAIIDGRQQSPLGSSGTDGEETNEKGWLFREVPWAYLTGGIAAGAVLEAATLRAIA